MQGLVKIEADCPMIAKIKLLGAETDCPDHAIFFISEVVDISPSPLFRETDMSVGMLHTSVMMLTYTPG